MSLVPPRPSPLVPGYRLDRYELLCPIAEGGMAQVWVARLRGKHGFEKLVAIKTILPRLSADFRFQQMFLDEARIASGIEHTNVAHILDLGDQQDILYLVMEWVDGDALTKIHRALEKSEQLLPVGVLLRVVADACGGLHAAHELRGKDGVPLGVVHRDVSPQNILVSTAGVAKLIDFGIAKARDRVAGDTNTGFLKGKVQYMAPEQAAGTPIDRRADVWAAGAILYHYLSGKPPFDGQNQLATLHLLTSGKPPLPLPARVPPQVAAVVKKALTHKREERFATAAEMQAAIEDAMIAAKVATTTAEVAAFCAKHTGDRAGKRKEAVDLALAAAAERARVEELLRPPNADSSGGISDAAERVRNVVLSPVQPRLLDPVREAQTTAPGVPVVPSVSGPPIDEGARLPAPPSVPTSVTLGEAALASPVAPPPMRRAGVFALATVGAVGIILGVVATIALRSGNGEGPVVAAQPASVTGGGSATFAARRAAAATPPSAAPSPEPLTLAPSAPVSLQVASTAAPSASSSGRAVPVAHAQPSPKASATPAREVRPRSTTKIPEVIGNGF